MSRQVLLLNASEEIINVIDWRKAVILLISNKAHRPYGYDHTYKINTVNNGNYELPSAIVLNEYVKIPFKSASLTRKNIIRRDEYECQYCSRSLNMDTQTIDHIVPVSRGGKHEWKNVVACCKPCNTKKSNKLLTECGMKLKRIPYAPTKKVLVHNIIYHQSIPEWERWMKYVS